MTQQWNEYGEAFPVTILWLDDNQVTQVKRKADDGITSLQIGAGTKKPRSVPIARRNHFRAAGVPLKARLAEFPVTEDSLLPVGFPLGASHFVAGQYVDVKAKTKDKASTRFFVLFLLHLLIRKLKNWKNLTFASL